MTKKLASAIFLTIRGVLVLALALVDWLAAKINVSERGYLLPVNVAREFHQAVIAAWHGQRKLPSQTSCTSWSRKACGPSAR